MKYEMYGNGRCQPERGLTPLLGTIHEHPCGWNVNSTTQCEVGNGTTEWTPRNDGLETSRFDSVQPTSQGGDTSKSDDLHEHN
jgi:hypothetical protein